MISFIAKSIVVVGVCLLILGNGLLLLEILHLVEDTGLASLKIALAGITTTVMAQSIKVK